MRESIPPLSGLMRGEIDRDTVEPSYVVISPSVNSSSASD